MIALIMRLGCRGETGAQMNTEHSSLGSADAIL